MACVFVAVFGTRTVARGQEWVPVERGVEFMQRTDPGPVRISALRIDLCASGVSMRVTGSDERGQRPSSWAPKVGAVAATNGGYYKAGVPTQYDPNLRGITVHEGQMWPDAANSSRQGWIAFGARRSALHPESLAPPAEPWFVEAVNGGIPLIVDGRVWGDSVRMPRTGAGLSADGRYAFLVAVDGRSETSGGMTGGELGTLLLSFGANQAMNMDGGGSTAMWVRNRGVVNQPSDGSERTVLNHIGVVVGDDTGVPGFSCPWRYGAELEESTFPGEVEITTAPGCEISGELRFRNTGEVTWDP
ncbi:MAG: phosphodiester glycosidase family protein, partial [Myxococcales bacterium]|nr:phosphodiester glycosidase family protein [Myxococcales bacterium]